MLSPIPYEQALIHFQRARMLERADRHDEAVREYRRALEYDPHLTDARRALAHFYRRRGLLSKAIGELCAIALVQDDFFTHFQLAELYLDIGLFDQALQHAHVCLARVPDDAAINRLAALAYLQRGQCDKAEAHLQAAVTRDPRHWHTFYLLGECFLRRARLDAATQALFEAERHAPDDEARRSILKRLQTVERHRAVGARNTLRDRLYADHGTFYLGSTQCDGTLSDLPPEYYLTYPDIGVMLHRLAILSDLQGWAFDAVAPIDRAAEPVASAIADLLRARLCEAETGHGRLLLVGTGTYQLPALALAAERIPESTTFCLATTDTRYTASLPHILGIAAHHGGGTPWESECQRLRASGAAPATVSECLLRATNLLREAVAAGPCDAARDVAQYYQGLPELLPVALAV